MSTTIDSLQIEIESSSKSADESLEKLAASLEKLKGIAKGGANLTTVVNQLSKLSSAVNAIQDPSGKLGKLVTALNQLGGIQKSNLGSVLNQLRKIPEIISGLETADLEKFGKQIQQLVVYIKPLSAEMEKVSLGFSRLPANIQKAINANAKLTVSNSKLHKSYGVLGTGIKSWQAKLGVYALAARRVYETIGGWVAKSNEYVENVNLFTVSMGKYAEEAFAYGEKVQDAMGIDLSEWIRNQGVFKQIVTGFGVVEDKAYTMSRGLTQIGYDISSFFNISIEDSMQKVQSGIAGELEPLRRLGYALDVATLQEIAYKHGIEMKVNAMTQAQKSQLRYIAIMEQSGNVMGDMSRTLITPANAMRILQQQITQLTRALGNMFIPILIKIIPYVQAFVKVLTQAAQAVAKILGFELPTIDYSGMEGMAGSAEDAASGLEGAADAAKKLKQYTLGFDELNVINPDQGASGSGGGAGAVGGDLGIDLSAWDYDFMGDLDSKVDELVPKMQTLAGIIGGIGASFLAWKIATSVLEGIKYLKDNLPLVKKAAGFTLIIGGLTLMLDNIKAILNGEYKSTDIVSLIKSVISGALIGGGLVLAGVSGWALPIAVLAVITITDVIANWDKFKDWFSHVGDAIKKLFSGDLKGFDFDISQALLDNISMDTWANKLWRKLFGDKVWDSAIKYIEDGGTIGSAITTLWNKTVSDLSGLMSQTWEEFKNKLSSRMGEIPNLIKNYFEKIDDNVSKIPDKLRKHLDKIGDWLSDIPNKIKSWFDGLTEKVKLHFAKIWEPIQKFDWSNLGKIIGNGFGTAFKNVSKWIESVGDSIKSGFQTYFTKTIPDFFNQVLPEAFSVFKDFIKSLPEKYLEAAESARDGLINVGTAIVDGIKEGWKTISTAVSDFVTGIIEGFKEGLGIHSPSTVFAELGKYIIDGLTKGFSDNWKRVSSWFTKEKWLGLFNNIYTALSSKWNEITVWWNNSALVNWWNVNVIPWFTVEKWQEEFSHIWTALQNKWDELVSWWNDTAIVGWWNDNVVPWFTAEKWSGEFQHIWDALSAKWNELVEWWKTSAIYKWWTENVAPWFTLQKWTNMLSTIPEAFSNAFKGAANNAISFLNKVIEGVESTINRAMDGLNELRKLANKIPYVNIPRFKEVSLPRIPTFQTGGFPETGEMFIARENGLPEMVGSIGRRAAVANNEQIVDAVSDGVYRAMVSAMSGNSDGSRPVELHVYLDGKQITASVEKYQRERGRTLLPGGVY